MASWRSHGSRLILTASPGKSRADSATVLAGPARRNRPIASQQTKTDRHYRGRIAALLGELGIPPDYADRCGLPLQEEATELCSIGPDIFDREQWLLPAAAEAWQAMRAAAAEEAVELQVVSAFRSVAYQADILRRKLEQGQGLADILRVSAAPGYSEHHSGRALDLTTPGYPALETAFEQSEAFAWLTAHADRFRFVLSFPRDNPFGIAYEPWHWAWQPA
jgi:D-alanyl-D-alanine carboxypeptidase